VCTPKFLAMLLTPWREEACALQLGCVESGGWTFHVVHSHQFADLEPRRALENAPRLSEAGEINGTWPPLR
jgi:hypothetical protein